jgi:2'-deoxynucleoside 5'-phosphate N-hydrolase
MNAYFTASIVGKKQYLDNYLRIIKLLTEKGYEVVADHIVNTTEAQIRFETKEERLNFHNQLEEWINNADFLVAETSFPSISVGYEIFMALAKGKPVLVLYNNGDPPSLLEHHKNEKLICEKYTSENLPEIIADFVNYAEGTADIRFNFFITPKIATYLEETAKKDKLPKSVYLRRLIEEDMKHRT